MSYQLLFTRAFSVISPLSIHCLCYSFLLKIHRPFTVLTNTHNTNQSRFLIQKKPVLEITGTSLFRNIYVPAAIFFITAICRCINSHQTHYKETSFFSNCVQLSFSLLIFMQLLIVCY